MKGCRFRVLRQAGLKGQGRLLADQVDQAVDLAGALLGLLLDRLKMDLLMVVVKRLTQRGIELLVESVGLLFRAVTFQNGEHSHLKVVESRQIGDMVGTGGRKERPWTGNFGCPHHIPACLNL